MAAAGAVAVEVGFANLMFHKPFSGRAVCLDAAGGADVVGGDRIAEDRERFCIDDVGNRRRGHFQTFEIRRVGDIGAACAPLIGFRTFDVDLLPMFVALIDVGIARLEHFAADIRGHQIVDFGVGGPDILQEDVITGLVLPDRGGGEILGHRALQCIGDNQRRRSEEVGAHIG